MTEIHGQPPDYTTQLRANWAVVSNPASLKAAGITVQPPTPAVVASLPAVATAAVAAAAARGMPPLQIAKYANVVDGKVTAVVDDGSPPGDPALVHLVVTVITAGAQPPSAVTYQLAARPHP